VAIQPIVATIENAGRQTTGQPNWSIGRDFAEP